MGCQICHSSCTVCRSSSDSSATELRRCPEIWKNFKNIVEDPTSVELNTDEQGNITVNGGNGQITVNGADDAVISVYNLSGIAVYQGHDSVISGLTKGVYLVRVADKTFKVAI